MRYTTEVTLPAGQQLDGCLSSATVGPFTPGSFPAAALAGVEGLVDAAQHAGISCPSPLVITALPAAWDAARPGADAACMAQQQLLLGAGIPPLPPTAPGKQQQQQQQAAAPRADAAPQQDQAAAAAGVAEPVTPQDSDHQLLAQEGSLDDATSSPGASDGRAKRAAADSRGGSPEPHVPGLSLCGLRRPASTTSAASAATAELLAGPGAAAGDDAQMQQAAAAAAAAAAAQDPLMQQHLLQQLQAYQQQLAAAGVDGAGGGFDSEFPQFGVNLIPANVVGQFFAVERPRPPPAGDQVNFAQRIMEICFSAVTNWPMNLALQFVVDGVSRGSPVDVSVGRSICKSQVSGSRQVIYYVRNPPLLRLARSFDARTVGYRLAGPTTLEWHLSTAPGPAAMAAAAKAPGRRKAGGGKGPRPAGSASCNDDGDDWGAGSGAASGAGAGSAEQLQQQVALLQQQLMAAGAAGAAGASALQQQLAAAPPALLGQLSQWLSAQQALAPGAAGARAQAQPKRRKQPRPVRSPFYGVQPVGGLAMFRALPLPRRCCGGGASDGDASDGGAAREAKRMRLAAGAFGGLVAP